MNRLLLALLVVCAVPAWAQDVVVRSKVEPEAGAVVGQHVRLMVDVLFKGDMPRPPRVSFGEAPGAQILRVETQATTMSDRIDGEAYAGQRFEFALYPRRGGTISVPAASVTLLDARGDETGTAKGQQLQAEIAVPSGVDPSGPVIATKDAKLEQQWNPTPTSAFKAGDALVRTITRTAADVPAMAMRELDLAAPPGVRVYRDQPQADDRQDRGDLVGRRIDRVTYVFETGGTFPIPAVVQPWWDLTDKRLKEAEGGGALVSVAAVPALRDWTALAAVAAAALGVLLGLAWWSVPRIKAAHRSWLLSEGKAFNDLLATCRGNDLAATYRAFVTWRSRLLQPCAVAPLARRLEEALFGTQPSAKWSASESRAFAGEVRGLWRRLQRESRRSQERPVLPPLNPSIAP